MLNKINERVKNIAEQVIKNAVITDGPDALGKELNSDTTFICISGTENLYESNLPEGVTLDTLKAINSYNNDFEAGYLLGIGKVTVLEMTNNSNITSASSYTPMSDKNTLTTFVSIEDKEGVLANGSMFNFTSNVKLNLPIERVTGEATQKDRVRHHLNELYVTALCECITK